MDAVWQRVQFGFAVLVLGDSELGPYHYQDMRGVAESRRHIGQPCPLPLWGELAHALVRRLDPAEADYLVIDDIAATGRPMPEEFPWMSHTGSLIILPLRKDSVAICAIASGTKPPRVLCRCRVLPGIGRVCPMYSQGDRQRGGPTGVEAQRGATGRAAIV